MISIMLLTKISGSVKKPKPFFILVKSFSLIYHVINFQDESFGLIQPTLIQQIKKILDEYPDDGQILKVRLTYLFCKQKKITK